MLEKYEEINLDNIIDRAGLFKTEIEPNEYDAILYDQNIKDLLVVLFSYDEQIVKCLNELNDFDLTNDFLDIHKKFIEKLLKKKKKLKDEKYKKEINNNKIDYKVERQIRESDLSYVLNKYLKNEPTSEDLLYYGSLDYYLDFLINIVINNYEEEIPNEIKTAISNRLDELNRFVSNN